jgi:hypothetical protein
MSCAAKASRDSASRSSARSSRTISPILQWYDAVCALQRRAQFEAGELRSAPMTGAGAAYYGLAYSLYLLAHNAELQDVLMKASLLTS